jgi:hypothetical protein
VFILVQEVRKFYGVIRFIIISLEADFFAEQKQDLFFDQRFGTVNLEGVAMKRETTRIAGFPLELCGEERVHADVRGYRGEGRFVGAERAAAELPVKLLDEPGEGGISVPKGLDAAELKELGKAALEGLP